MSTQPSVDRGSLDPSSGTVSFDAAWPDLAERLRRSLTARGVPAQDRDDVVQETALRVYRVWDSLDPTRPRWPFVITVGVNIWRDIVRSRTGRIASEHPSAWIEVTAEHDVERDVLARQELRQVGVAMQSMAPEQRRLLLATEEFADTLRPLLPAERVARMRARRQLARAVGRASAAVALLWIRRPGRASGAVATAYAGAMAAAILTAPNMALMPAVTAAPPQAVLLHEHPVTHHAAAAPVPRHATTDKARQAVRAAVPTAAATSLVPAAPDAAPADPTRVRTRVCTPARPPAQHLVRVVVRIGSTELYQTDGSGDEQPIATTPPVEAHGASGCVGVG